MDNKGDIAGSVKDVAGSVKNFFVIPQKVTVVIKVIAISWHVAQSNKSSYLEGQREG
jgi:hypothetical protein